MSAPMLALLQADRLARVVPVCTVYWPSGAGGTKHYASEPFRYFDQRVVEGGIGDVRMGASERPSDLSFQTLSIKLADTDKAITQILNGPVKVRRSRALLRWAHHDLAEADWFTLFDGIVDDWSWSNSGVSLNVKTDDVALQSFVPKQPLLPGSVPGLVNTARGLYASIIYGIHDAQSLDGKGQVKCPNVILDATNGYWYMVGAGVLKSVPRVYKNGTLQTLTTHYTVQYPKWGGATYTAIKFVSATVATDTVAADVEGLTDAGDGTGGLITAAVDQIKHFLVNFVYGDWRTGSWLATSTAPIDSSSFSDAATFVSKFGGEGSIYVGGGDTQSRAIAVFNDWLKSQPMLRGRWSGGVLGLKPINHLSGEYQSTAWIQHERDEIGNSFEYSTDSSQLVSRVSLSYLYGQNAGKYWQSLDLQDLALWETEKTTENLTLKNSAARFQ